jgi:hypothetical protein
VKPIVGILAAQMQGSAASDVLKIEGVRVDGNFALSALYALGVQSSAIYASQFYNYEPNGMVGIFTGTNLWNIRSPFAPVSQANDMRVSDWEITASEWHHLASGCAVAGRRVDGQVPRRQRLELRPDREQQRREHAGRPRLPGRCRARRHDVLLRRGAGGAVRAQRAHRRAVPGDLELQSDGAAAQQ